MKTHWFGVIGAMLVLSICGSASAQLKVTEDTTVQELRTLQEIGKYADQMEKYLFVVDHLARMSENPTSSAIAAALQVNEILKDQPQQAIDYFNRTLPDVKNDSVRRVIRLQLAELYRRTSQPDKALEQIRELMILAPAGSPHTTHTTTTTHPPAAAHPTHPAEPAPEER
jgi:predicted negative regulator of RcsB-dependent stress response